MIPVFLRDAWTRARAEEPEEQPLLLDAKPSGDPVQRVALVTIAVVLVMAALWAGRHIAVPLVTGVIFGLVLGPVVDRLMRLGLPQALAAALVVLSLVLGLSLMVALFAAPFAIWSDRLPEIVAGLKQRVGDLFAALRQVEALGGLTPPSSARTVRIEEGTPWASIASTSSSIAGGLLIAVATSYFYLATRRQMKARALRLCLGANARRTAGQFLSDIEVKIAGYFGVITLINLGMGLVTVAIAWAWGMPFPIFWGLLAFVLNYVAFIGPIVMAVLVAGSGLLDDRSLVAALTPAIVYYGAHLVEGNVVTPLAVGRRLTVNPFLVFMSFVFWLWLWGPVGAFLATPILLVGTLSFEAYAPGASSRTRRPPTPRRWPPWRCWRRPRRRPRRLARRRSAAGRPGPPPAPRPRRRAGAGDLRRRLSLAMSVPTPLRPTARPAAAPKRRVHVF